MHVNQFRSGGHRVAGAADDVAVTVRESISGATSVSMSPSPKQRERRGDKQSLRHGFSPGEHDGDADDGADGEGAGGEDRQRAETVLRKSIKALSCLLDAKLEQLMEETDCEVLLGSPQCKRATCPASCSAQAAAWCKTCTIQMVFLKIEIQALRSMTDICNGSLQPLCNTKSHP